jgi:hypothetical protein
VPSASSEDGALGEPPAGDAGEQAGGTRAVAAQPRAAAQQQERWRQTNEVEESSDYDEEEEAEEEREHALRRASHAATSTSQQQAQAQGAPAPPDSRELIFRLERHGEGWGEEILPRLVVEKRQVAPSQRRQSSRPDPWEVRPPCLPPGKKGG